MDLFSSQFVMGIVVMALPVLWSLTIHEFAHARSALALGDTTARDMGRCTLNPLPHLDPIGTIMLFFVGFGWAKPVMVNYSRLRHGSAGRFIVSAAGPGTNLLFAILCAIALRILSASGVRVSPHGDFDIPSMCIFMLVFTMFINLALCFFNLIPLFPLDGHHMLREVLPNDRTKYNFMQFQRRYGYYMLLGILVIPRFLPGFIDPIGWWFSHTLVPTLGLLLGNALELALNAMERYDNISPF